MGLCFRRSFQVWKRKSSGLIGIEVHSDCPTRRETVEKIPALDGGSWEWNKRFLRLGF